jgi:hypothetical protein
MGYAPSSFAAAATNLAWRWNDDAAVRRCRSTDDALPFCTRLFSLSDCAAAIFPDSSVAYRRPGKAEMGKSAFFVPGINQLNVFIDERRFVILTISSAPDATAKATAVALARDIKN